MVSLFDLYLTFFKIGTVTFGGGYAMLPILERELVNRKKWTDMDTLMDCYAISQVTPGVIAVNVSTFVGYSRRRVPGGIAATAGVVSPSILIITLIALFVSNFEEIVWVQKALAGVNVAVAALLTYAVFNFAKKAIKKWWSVIFYAAAFCAVFFFKVPSVAVVVAAALGGILVGHFSGAFARIDSASKGSENGSENANGESVK